MCESLTQQNSMTKKNTRSYKEPTHTERETIKIKRVVGLETETRSGHVADSVCKHKHITPYSQSLPCMCALGESREGEILGQCNPFSVSLPCFSFWLMFRSGVTLGFCLYVVLNVPPQVQWGK